MRVLQTDSYANNDIPFTIFSSIFSPVQMSKTLKGPKDVVFTWA